MSIKHPSVKVGQEERTMGNRSSLTSEELSDMQSISNFTPQELKRLFRIFRKIDTNKNGTLSLEEFMAVPEVENNPLVARVIATFDSDKNGEVDFKEFISALTVFTRQNAKQDKYSFTFKVYDVDGDGFISNADLFHVLKAMVGNNLNEVQLQQLVDRTILKGDKDHDGKLSFNEYIEMIKDTDIDEKLTMNISNTMGSYGI